MAIKFSWVQILFGLVLNLSLPLLAYGEGVTAPTSPAKTYQSPLAQFLAPHVQTLTREVWIYHWGSRESYISSGIPQSGGVAVTVDMSRYLKLMVGLFENDKAPPANLFGNGLYAAIDPVSTSNIAGTIRALLQINLSTGARILHAEGAEKVFPSSLIAHLSSKNCVLTSGPIVRDLFSSSGICRKILVAALRELGVDAVTYGYRPIYTSDCDATTQIAFVITGRRMIQAQTRFLTDEIPDGEPRNYERLFVNVYAKTRGFAAIWPTPDLSGTTIDFSESVKTHIFGCSSKYLDDQMQ